MVADFINTRSSSSRRWWTLTAASIATFMLLLDFTVVNLALPAIQREIGGSFSDLQWMVDAYAVAMAALILIAGSIADRVGHRRMFILGITVFAASSLGCGMAGRPIVLNAARAMQGVGAAATMASSLALLGVTFEGRDRQLALAIWGAVSGTAVAIGPLVGGVIVEYLSWHWIFFINVPIGVAMVMLALGSIGDTRSTVRESFDWLGALLLALGLGALCFALLRGNATGWGSATIIGLFGCAAALIVAFAVVETRVVNPILDLKLFSARSMVGASLAVFTLGVTVFASIFFLSLYLQNILRYSPLDAGLRLLPVTVGSFIAAFTTLWVGRYLSARWIVGIGLGLCGSAFLLMHGLTPRSKWTALLLGSTLAGVGAGLVNPTVAGMALKVGDVTRAGMASGLNSATRLLGTATGIGLLGAIFQHRVEVRLHTLAPELPNRAGEAVSAGIIHPVVSAFPPLLQGAIRYATTDAFVSGLNDICLVCLVIALVGGFIAVVVVLRKAEVATDIDTHVLKGAAQPLNAEAGN